MSTLGKVVVVVLAVWLAVTLLGLLIEGLFWLAVVGALAFLVTAALGGRSKLRRRV